MIQMPAKNGLSILIKVQNAFLPSPVLHMVSKFVVLLSTVWNVNAGILRVTKKRNFIVLLSHSVKKRGWGNAGCPLDKPLTR